MNAALSYNPVLLYALQGMNLIEQLIMYLLGTCKCNIGV